MAFSPQLGAVRFGTGLSPRIKPAQSVADILARLQGPDFMVATYEIPPFETVRQDLIEVRKFVGLRKEARKTKDKEAEKMAQRGVRRLRRRARNDRALWLRQAVVRAAMTEDGMRERLTHFWADHFTARGKQGVMLHSTGAYVAETIRPNVTGRFCDMLKAVVVSPMMLLYLDQVQSIGPNSVFGKNRKRRGLNENFAREILELHTVGVEGPYTQQDVTELAELLTGLNYTPLRGFFFDVDRAEPGAETVLGVAYGSDRTATLDTIFQALDDLSVNPATAQHLAQKLVVHFVSDTPDPDLVTHMATKFRQSGGELMALYAAMLEHPASWSPELANVKPPFDYMVSALRALDIPEKRYINWEWKDAERNLGAPLQVMGQHWENPVGPDGWPEVDAEWITPVGIAGRIQWAMTIPPRIKKPFPDPRDFVGHALGSLAPASVTFAAGAAETPTEGVALVLASPAFQRR